MQQINTIVYLLPLKLLFEWVPSHYAIDKLGQITIKVDQIKVPSTYFVLPLHRVGCVKLMCYSFVGEQLKLSNLMPL